MSLKLLKHTVSNAFSPVDKFGTLNCDCLAKTRFLYFNVECPVAAKPSLKKLQCYILFQL